MGRAFRERRRVPARLAPALAGDDNRGAVAEEALVGGDADGGAVDLPAGGLAPELPTEFANRGEGWGGDGLPEAREASRGVDRDATADGGGAAAQQFFGFALGAQ